MPREPPTPAEPLVKGSVIRELLLWHERRFGAAATARLALGLPPGPSSLVDPSRPALGILAGTWYPISLTHPMLDRVVASSGDDGRDLAAEANRDVVPRMIRGVYRVLFVAVATPELYARHVPRLWRRLHSTGDRVMVLRSPGEALSSVENWPGHHVLMCWLTIYTMAFVFEAMGYPRWSVERVACVGHGARRCETLLRYAK